MNVTVAICTWNRAKLIDQTLAQMRQLRIPDGVEWELLVVDNNCNDGTDAVLTSYTAKLPLRKLKESRQGKSHAANLAVANTTADLLIWTDDDVLVDENWLAEYVRAANAWPEASFFGGRIDPLYEVEPPAWFRKYEYALLPLRSLDAEERLLTPREQVFGANMAFRLPVMKRYPFDPDLGRVGATFVLGEEAAIINRMYDDGHLGVWVPSAAIKHVVPAARMKSKNVWRYMHGLGRMNVRMKEFCPSGHELGGAPRWLYPQYVKAFAAYAWQVVTRQDDPFPAMRQAAWLEGVIVECWHQRRLAKATGAAPQPLEERIATI
jgi:glycosyltransferase involved in cell wall biosynthesis